MPALVRLLLGPGHEAAVPAARLLVLGAPPLALHACARSLLDARHEAAVGTRILAAAFGALALASAAGAALGLSGRGLLGLLVAALYLLGALSFLEARKALRGGAPAAPEG